MTCPRSSCHQKQNNGGECALIRIRNKRRKDEGEGIERGKKREREGGRKMNQTLPSSTTTCTYTPLLSSEYHTERLKRI